MNEPMLWVRVADKYPIAQNTVALELVPEIGDTLPPFTAGAYVDVDLGFGQVRQYSIANDPSETHRYLLGVLRDPNSRGTSAALVGGVTPGCMFQISQPKNLFPLEENADYTVLLGGGIGITPMLAFGHRLHNLGKEFELHFCARSLDNAPFVKQLEMLPFRDRIQLHLDDQPETKLDLAMRLIKVPPTAHLYTCGPKGFMDAMVTTARVYLDDEQIHQESFDNADAPPAENLPFEVQIRSTGEVLQVGAGEALVDVLQANGLPIMRRCPNSFCGGCAVPVVEGDVEHRDTLIPEHIRMEHKLMLTCVSRADGEDKRLVLDL